MTTTPNPILDAIDAGHVTYERHVQPREGVWAYTGEAVCRLDEEPMPCGVLKASRAQNARRLEAASRASWQHQLLPGVSR